MLAIEGPELKGRFDLNFSILLHSSKTLVSKVPELFCIYFLLFSPVFCRVAVFLYVDCFSFAASSCGLHPRGSNHIPLELINHGIDLEQVYPASKPFHCFHHRKQLRIRQPMPVSQPFLLQLESLCYESINQKTCIWMLHDHLRCIMSCVHISPVF